MRVLIEHDGKVHEFIPAVNGGCARMCSLHDGPVCEKMAVAKNNDAICHQLYGHLVGRNNQGYFKEIT